MLVVCVLLRLLSTKTLHSGNELISEFPKQCLIISKALFLQSFLLFLLLLEKFLEGKSGAYE